MNLDTIITVLLAVGGATWALRSKLSDIERALSAHVASDTAQFEELRADVIDLRKARRGRR